MVTVIFILLILADVVVLSGHAHRLRRLEETMTAQRYCVHLSYTADAAPWAVSIFPANTEPTLSDTLPTVLVSSPMTCDAAEHLVRQFYDQAVEGLRPCDYASGRA